MIWRRASEIAEGFLAHVNLVHGRSSLVEARVSTCSGRVGNRTEEYWADLSSFYRYKSIRTSMSEVYVYIRILPLTMEAEEQGRALLTLSLAQKQGEGNHVICFGRLSGLHLARETPIRL
jgi:hypothetical protein